VANVYANRLALDEVKEIAVDDGELPRLLLQRGDLLVVEGNGSVDQIGRVALWDGSIDPVVHQNHLIKVRFGRSPLERWVLTWLLSPSGRVAIERVASSTSGLHTLSISKVQSLPVPLPPENEQVRVLETVDQLLSIVDASADGLDAGLRRCRRLRQTVLRSAFEGKLVDQDPADEPADVLLARIHAERASATPAAGKTKRSRKLKAAS
jgi:type I restriction enzyme S subunit